MLIVTMLIMTMLIMTMHITMTFTNIMTTKFITINLMLMAQQNGVSHHLTAPQKLHMHQEVSF
jgi:hypothetical protein